MSEVRMIGTGRSGMVYFNPSVAGWFARYKDVETGPHPTQTVAEEALAEMEMHYDASAQPDHLSDAIEYALAPAPPADPWAHRSKGIRCDTCMWFAPKSERRDDKCTPLGRCRRHAPTMSGYPAVYADDWCGDHKLKESIR